MDHGSGHTRDITTQRWVLTYSSLLQIKGEEKHHGVRP